MPIGVEGIIIKMDMKMKIRSTVLKISPHMAVIVSKVFCFSICYLEPMESGD